MTVVMKPATLTFTEADVDADWQGANFWDHLVLAIAFDEGSGNPQAWVRGTGKVAFNLVSGSPAWSSDASLGTILSFNAATPNYLRLTNANLPTNFPVKVSTHYTALFYGTVTSLAATNNIAVKQTNTGDPYLLYTDGTGKVAAHIGGTTYTGTTVLSSATPYLIGSVWDGVDLKLIVDGTREGGAARAASLPTNTGDLWFGTRQDTTNSYGGKAGIFYVLNDDIPQATTQALASDPYGPVTVAGGGGGGSAPMFRGS